ncbi:hypothetical protein [Rhizobium sp. BE258]|uniref:hypothetical protein n=1 Tax=Rhizobium sp. BE258 TaxID=2817722 RepID=UPI002861F33C|nr:hypothetical protein [Rhizobium sp. BE258]MDR7141919.1 hypothetical protein [Rhizobium sp. BE258]
MKRGYPTPRGVEKFDDGEAWWLMSKPGDRRLSESGPVCEPLSVTKLARGQIKEHIEHLDMLKSKMG